MMNIARIEKYNSAAYFLLLVVFLVPTFLSAQTITVTPSDVVISAQVGTVESPAEDEETTTTTGGYGYLSSSVIFSGRVTPFSSVFVYENGKIIASTVSNAQAEFSVTVYRIFPRNHSFMLYASRAAGEKSANATFLLTIPYNTVVTVSGIMLEFPIIDRGPCSLFADLDCDNKVDIIDFSIMKFWYNQKTNFPSYVDLNSDGIISMIDFSILAYNWTN